MRWLFGLILVGFGLLCFNYTKPETLDEHRSWAAEKELPAPGNVILWSGAGAAVVGAFMLGNAKGRSSS